jgi:hypothetical protein
MVNAAGLVGLAGRQLNVGYELAGQRVTLRMDGTQMTVINHDGELLRTLPCAVPPDGETICVVPRTTTGEIHRYKAYASSASSTRTPQPIPGPAGRCADALSPEGRGRRGSRTPAEPGLGPAVGPAPRTVR